MRIIVPFLIGVHLVNGFTQPSSNLRMPGCASSESASMTGTCLTSVNPAIASALSSKLYPASMIGTLGEIYFRTRNEMECPRGAAAGFIAQVATIIISIPMISMTKAEGIQSFLEVDWLHFIEAIMFWASIHAQCMSFRQAVLSVENGGSLPKSAVAYTPTVRALLIVFVSILAIAMGHFFANCSWQNTQLFGGVLNPPTPGHDMLRGEPGFLTWVFHYSMIIDYCLTLPRYMWRWGDITGNKQWKRYTFMHVPAFAVNAVVMANHLHRDRLIALKILHPPLVFLGSIATLYGSFAVARAKGWNLFNRKECIDTVLRNEGAEAAGEDWDASYTFSSIAAGSLLAYGSLYLTV